MPIQIRELVIRATVDEGSSGEASPSASGDGGENKKQSQEKMIRKCVDEVLEVLRLQNEY